MNRIRRSISAVIDRHCGGHRFLPTRGQQHLPVQAIGSRCAVAKMKKSASCGDRVTSHSADRRAHSVKVCQLVVKDGAAGAGL